MANQDAEAQRKFREWLDSQSGYVGKENKAQWWEDYRTGQQNQGRLNTLFDPQGLNFGITGSPKEVTGRIEGLERAKALTGQSPFQIGADYQEAYGNIKKRSTLSDTGSELLRASKAGAVAEARNAMRQDGVKGGAAAGAASSIERQKAYDVNNQLMENQRKAEMDYMNAVKSNANFTIANEMNYGALATGQDFQAAPTNSNGFGTVICTELHRQGFYSDKIYQADMTYGAFMKINHPEVYWGYRLWADPVVKLMKKSPLFTRMIALIAVPWAKNMAGEDNFLGALISAVGEPICYLIGKCIGGKYVNQKA
jgi:hypothetical protein